MNAKSKHLKARKLESILFALAVTALSSGAAYAGTSYTTQGATNITSTSATLNGTASSTCSVSNIAFQYGATAAYGFAAVASPSSVNTASATASAQISGLVCNATYHFRLTGEACSTTVDGADQTFTTAALGAATGVQATADSLTSAVVSWTAPSSNCGSAIISYTVKAVQDPSKTCLATSGTSCNVTGLTTGTAYTFTVTAVNGNGIGDVSAPSNSVTPSTAQTIANLAATPSTGTVGGSSTLTATGGASGNPVTFATSTPSVCTVSGSSVRYTSAGTCTVTANQAGGGTYGPATTASLSIVTTIGSSSSCLGVSSPSGFAISPCVFNMASDGGASVFSGMTSTLSTSLGLANVRNMQQGSNGTVTLEYDGGKLAFLPINVARLDGRANGVYQGQYGKYVVVNGGTAVTVAPGILNFDQLATLMPGWSVQVDAQGGITASKDGVVYSVKPAYFVQATSTAGPSIGAGADGVVRFVDSQGNSQVLYPAFAEPDTLQLYLSYADGSATSTVNLDGTVQAQFNGQTFTLTPDSTLSTLNSSATSGTFWKDGGSRYRMRTMHRLNTTQGFSMQ